MIEPAVAVIGVTKVFPVPFQRRSVVAVRDLNLEVSSGQIYGLLGPNGSGKSTTLKIILGLVSPTRGKTEIFGRDSNDWSRAAKPSVSCRRILTSTNISPAPRRFAFYGKLCGLRGARLRDRVDRIARTGWPNECA